MKGNGNSMSTLEIKEVPEKEKGATTEELNKSNLTDKNKRIYNILQNESGINLKDKQERKRKNNSYKTGVIDKSYEETDEQTFKKAKQDNLTFGGKRKTKRRRRNKSVRKSRRKLKSKRKMSRKKHKNI